MVCLKSFIIMELLLLIGEVVKCHHSLTHLTTMNFHNGPKFVRKHTCLQFYSPPTKKFVQTNPPKSQQKKSMQTIHMRQVSFSSSNITQHCPSQ
jgi:hypothetical protein